MIVDVYHSGLDGLLKPPFLMVSGGEKSLPVHPAEGGRWTFWKRVQLGLIAVNVAKAKADIHRQGFHIQ